MRVCLKRIISNKFYHLFICSAAMVSPAFGTYYTAILSGDFFVVAMDSRIVTLLNPALPPFDRSCKIVPLSNEIIFFATGFVKADGAMSFNAENIARQTYNYVAGRRPMYKESYSAMRLRNENDL
jgi:hypothetical protein